MAEGHSSSVLTCLNKLRSDRFICDFMIFVQGEKFDTHRLVLAANSGYFEKYFSRERDQTSITIDNIYPEEMQQCIEYMYTSKCDFKFESIPKILEAASFFQIPHLAEDCLRFLSSDLTPERCFHVLNLARRSPRDVQKVAQDIIRNNLKIVMSSMHFRKISEDDLFRFICDAEPEIYWKAITTYCRDRERMFVRLVDKIDFEKLPFSFLLTTVLSDPLTMCQLPWTRQFAVKAIFHDTTLVKQSLNTRNCFLLEILSSDPSFKRFVDPTLKATVKEFMRTHFTKIKSEQGICFLSKDSILALLQSEDVGPEESKWDMILKWMRGDPKRARSKKTFRDLFHTIKLNRLSVNFLKEMVGREEFVTKDAVCMESLMCELFLHIDRLLQLRPVSPCVDTPKGGDVEMAAKELNNKEKCQEEKREEKFEDAAENLEQTTDRICARETDSTWSMSSASTSDHAQRNSHPAEEDPSQRTQNDASSSAGSSQKSQIATSTEAAPCTAPIRTPPNTGKPQVTGPSQNPPNTGKPQVTGPSQTPPNTGKPQVTGPSQTLPDTGKPQVTGPSQAPPCFSTNGPWSSQEFQNVTPRASEPFQVPDKPAQGVNKFSFNPLSAVDLDHSLGNLRMPNATIFTGPRSTPFSGPTNRGSFGFSPDLRFSSHVNRFNFSGSSDPLPRQRDHVSSNHKNDQRLAWKTPNTLRALDGNYPNQIDSGQTTNATANDQELSQNKDFGES